MVLSGFGTSDERRNLKGIKVSLFNSLFEKISRIVIAYGFKDKLIWKANANGEYTINKFYVWNDIRYLLIPNMFLALWIVERLIPPRRWKSFFGWLF
jgi:hypothetical protein